MKNLTMKEFKDARKQMEERNFDGAISTANTYFTQLQKDYDDFKKECKHKYIYLLKHTSINDLNAVALHFTHIANDDKEMYDELCAIWSIKDEPVSRHKLEQEFKDKYNLREFSIFSISAFEENDNII